jgi:hypothetical protein
MPPTDDDARDRIIGEVQALRGELSRLRDRAHARDLKRRLITLYLEAATLDLQLANAHVSPLIYEAVGAIIRTMGTAAWDEPETVEEAKARMRTLPAAPGSIAEMLKLIGNPMLDEMLGGDPDAPRPDSRVPGPEKPWHERTGADAAPMIYGRKDALPPTLTDKELDRIVRQWENGKLIAYVCGKCGSSNRLESDQGRDHVIAAGLSRLVAEFRRLRSDPFTFMPMLTDKELETIDALIQVAIPMPECKSDKAPPKAFARLISEHRRLRSDDWLQAAAVEAISGGELARLQRDAMIAILRKHRDGKA